MCSPLTLHQGWDVSFIREDGEVRQFQYRQIISETTIKLEAVFARVISLFVTHVAAAPSNHTSISTCVEQKGDKSAERCVLWVKIALHISHFTSHFQHKHKPFIVISVSICWQMWGNALSADGVTPAPSSGQGRQRQTSQVQEPGASALQHKHVTLCEPMKNSSCLIGSKLFTVILVNIDRPAISREKSC